jgi:hypothetical protein
LALSPTSISTTIVVAAYKLHRRSKGLGFRQMTTTYHAMGRSLVTMRRNSIRPT